MASAVGLWRGRCRHEGEQLLVQRQTHDFIGQEAIVIFRTFFERLQIQGPQRRA